VTRANLRSHASKIVEYTLTGWKPLIARRAMSRRSDYRGCGTAPHRCRANARTDGPPVAGGWVVLYTLPRRCRAPVLSRNPQCNPELTGTLRVLRAKTRPKHPKRTSRRVGELESDSSHGRLTSHSRDARLQLESDCACLLECHLHNRRYLHPA
jgi:hypothetical protein